MKTYGPLSLTVFALSEAVAAKNDPALIGADEQFFRRIAATVQRSTAEVTARLTAVRAAPMVWGREAVERDTEIRRLAGRLAVLQRFGMDLCLGHVVPADGSEPVYIGRLGLRDEQGAPLLIDWRTQAAEPFFAATHADPMGLARRRRYRWGSGRIIDYWDEVFVADEVDRRAVLDDQSAFIASLGEHRSTQMRDVLATIATDQDAVIRAHARGALVVDGGPGTGKTVVALHRAAYLLHAEQALARGGGVLIVGPHEPYLSYVADVLPSLGEAGVALCTLDDLVAESHSATAESDAKVAALKETAGMVAAIEAAVRFYEKPPTESIEVSIGGSEIVIDDADWAEAFRSADPELAHNAAREQVWEALLDIVIDRNTDPDGSPDELRDALQHNAQLRKALETAWTLVDPTVLVTDLWSVPAYLRLCAPWLSNDEVQVLQRPESAPWTRSDLPILDAARRRLGDLDTVRQQRRYKVALTAERARVADDIERLTAADTSGELLLSMLGGSDMQDALIDQSSLPTVATNRLAGPFAHIVIDEAQELTDAQWQMLLARCPSRSFTIVGDRAQARRGFSESWHDRLERAGMRQVAQTSLSVNYRTPAEIMAEAELVIRAALPDANVPTSVRATGVPVTHCAVPDIDAVLAQWLSTHTEGTACIITANPAATQEVTERSRVRVLSPETSKGLEFDLVVLTAPEEFGDGIGGAVDRYVGMTRATAQLVIAHR
jgi:DNA helicase IV